LQRLVDHGFLAPLPEREKIGPGRRPSPRYAIHPHANTFVHIERNEHN